MPQLIQGKLADIHVGHARMSAPVNVAQDYQAIAPPLDKLIADLNALVERAKRENLLKQPDLDEAPPAYRPAVSDYFETMSRDYHPDKSDDSRQETVNSERTVEWQFGGWSGLPSWLCWIALLVIAGAGIVMAIGFYRHTLRDLSVRQRLVFVALRCGFLLSLLLCLAGPARVERVLRCRSGCPAPGRRGGSLAQHECRRFARNNPPFLRPAHLEKSGSRCHPLLPQPELFSFQHLTRHFT